MKRQTLKEFYQVNPKYIEQLYLLQTELLQLHLRKHKQRLLILFEGGNTAGKGSNAIRIEAFPNRIKGPYSDHKGSASGLFS